MTTIPILLYHSICDDPAVEIAPWTVSRSAFAEHVAAIAESGRTALTITELAACLRGEVPLPQRAMAVTFDDGYADTADAVQRLAGAAIPATVYVTSGTVGDPRMVSREALAELAEMGRGVEVGAHSVSHRRLDELGSYELAVEVVDSRSRIEQLTQRPCVSFAYPHGNHDQACIRAVRDAGYTSAVAVRNALSHPADNVFALARVTVESGTSAAAVARVLEGQYAVARPTELLRTRGYRRFRRLRRRLIGTAATSR